MQKIKILVVDDEQDVRDSLANFLRRKLDCETEKAADGTEAIAKLKNSKFDLIVLDIKMPGLSGIDVIKETKKSSPQAKILVVSAYDSQEIAEEALKIGAADYILKPQSAEAIEQKVRAVLNIPEKTHPR